MPHNNTQQASQEAKHKNPFANSFRFTCLPAEQVFVYCDGHYSIEGEDYWYSVGEALARSSVKHGSWVVLPSSHTKLSDEESFTLAEQIVSKALAPAGKGVADDSESTIQGIVQEWIGSYDDKHDGRHIFLQGHTVYYIRKQGDDITITYKQRNPNPTFAEVVAEQNEIAYKKPTILNTIKEACKATSGRLSVRTTQEGFEVYHPWFVDNVKVVDEDVLEKLLRVIVLVEGDA